jgi:hypothetical protein
LPTCPQRQQQEKTAFRKWPKITHTTSRLTADTIALARQYGRYGYRKIAGLLELSTGRGISPVWGLQFSPLWRGW